MSNNKPTLPPETYVMQSQSREALYEAQQPKVEPIPAYVIRESIAGERVLDYHEEIINGIVAHYNTHVVARLNTPHS